jgi:hypothetical protein
MKGPTFLQSILLGIGIVLCLFYVVQFYRRKEGFETAEKILNNALSPLGSSMSPLGASVAPIGVSKAEGKEIANTLSSALHHDTVVADGEGSIMKGNTMPKFKPRIDDETSFMGHVKFCEEQGANPNPFSDKKFRELCGMCMTEGTLLNGKQFTTPTGIVVYPEDKDSALEEKRKNGYPFSRVIPSYKSATCKGSSTGPNALPSIALNASEYTLMNANKACAKVSTVGVNGCAVCLPTGKNSYLPDTASIESSELFVYGSGTLNYTIGSVTGKLVLNETKAERINLGNVEEGTSIQLSIARDSRIEGPFIGGFIQSTTPRSAKFKLPIDRLSLTVEGSQGPPKKGRSVRSKEFGGPIPYLYPVNQKEEIFAITGFFPFTFLQSSEIAAFDCPTGPFMKKQSSASQFSKDPCMGQAEGSLSDACLRSKIEENGCSAAGTLYKSPQEEGIGESIMSFVNKVATYANMSNKDREAAKKCTGKSFPTSCDPILSGNEPSNKCLTDLYLNNLVESSFGSSYTGSTLASTSINPETKKPMFCQATGSLHPKKSNTLSNIYKRGYKGNYGLDGLRMFLSDIFNRATDDTLSPSVADDQGGRKTSIEQCFTEVPDLRSVEKPKELVIFYKHCNYEGQSASKDVGRYNMGEMGMNNDDISSIRIPQGYKVTLHHAADFGGYSMTATSSLPCLVNNIMPNGVSWNDQISSFIVETLEQPREFVTFYKHCNYEGQSASKDVGRYDMGQMGMNNDDISSIRIPQGYKVTIYQHASFGGYSMAFTKSAPCLVNNYMPSGVSWNDQISSFIIETVDSSAPAAASPNYIWPANYSKNAVFSAGTTIAWPWSSNHVLMHGVRLIPSWQNLLNSMHWLWFRQNPLALPREERGVYKIYNNPFNTTIQVKFHWVIFGSISYIGLNNRPILASGPSQPWFGSVDLTLPPGESVLQVNCVSLGYTFAGFLGACIRNGSEPLFLTDRSWGWMQNTAG